MDKYIVSLSFGNYLKADGGVDKAICEYQEQFNAINIDYLHISPVLPNKQKLFLGKHRLYTILLNGKYLGFFDERDVWNYLNRLHEKEECVGLHIHHIKKFDKRFIIKIVNCLNAPIYFFLHDYYSICEQPNLLFNNEKFCGNDKKNNSLCGKCQYGKNIQVHMQDTLEILNSCKNLNVVSPSELTLEIWKKTYESAIKSANYFVVPHQELVGCYKLYPEVKERIKIGFIGRYGDNKGKNQWETVTKVIEEENLPYDLLYLGFSEIPKNSVNKIYVKVDSNNPNKMLDEMRESGINCAFMWSLCPETYSYAYFEALAANLFIITNRNSGNIAYLTCKNKNGIVYNELSDLISDLRLNKLHSKLQQYIGNPDLAGPESYITNSQIKELYGREKYEFLPYSEGDRVNPFVKKTMEFFYLKKNKR